jgi:phospholipid transport system substrate-binding protein
MMSAMLTRLGMAIAIVAVPVIASAQSSDPAAVEVEAYGRAVGDVAREAGVGPFKARVERFIPLVHRYYDLPGALALVAGPTWASASNSDKSAALAAFTRNSAVQHAENFHGAGFVLSVEPKTVPRGSDRLVRAHTGGETLIYRMRQVGGQWRIIDVSARGVSQLAVQRADFAGVVAKGGVAALTAKLVEINARPRS